MPAILANASNFLLNTDYPIDKIVYLLNTSISTGAFVDVTIPHGLPFIPLPILQWSLTPDFSISYEDNVGPFPSGNPGYPFSLQLAIEANATNIIIRAQGITISTTAYVRIICFQPSTSNDDVAATASVGDSFITSTDYNYMKLIDTGTSAVVSGGTTTIPLSYKPKVLAWVQTAGGTVFPVSLSYPLNNTNIEVTASSFVIRNDSFSNVTVHYRSYVDE